MTPEQLGELMRTLGVASPLVGLLIWMLRQATEERQRVAAEATVERKDITNRFLTALETTVSSATRAIQENTAATKELSATIEANRKSSVDEHGRIVDAIGKLGRRDA